MHFDTMLPVVTQKGRRRIEPRRFRLEAIRDLALKQPVRSGLLRLVEFGGAQEDTPVLGDIRAADDQHLAILQ